jgi:hypothetical protein
MAESFLAALETELIDRSDWASPPEARAAVFEYIEVFYNRSCACRAFSERGRPLQGGEAIASEARLPFIAAPDPDRRRHRSRVVLPSRPSPRASRSGGTAGL